VSKCKLNYFYRKDPNFPQFYFIFSR